MVVLELLGIYLCCTAEWLHAGRTRSVEEKCRQEVCRSRGVHGVLLSHPSIQLPAAEASVQSVQKEVPFRMSGKNL